MKIQKKQTIFSLGGRGQVGGVFGGGGGGCSGGGGGGGHRMDVNKELKFL